MLHIKNIFEEDYMLLFLEKKNLVKQYKKAKKILNNYFNGNKIKYRKPKKNGIIYFRINKQFRALCRMDKNSNLIVFDIDNHQ